MGGFPNGDQTGAGNAQKKMHRLRMGLRGVRGVVFVLDGRAGRLA